MDDQKKPEPVIEIVDEVLRVPEGDNGVDLERIKKFSMSIINGCMGQVAGPVEAVAAMIVAQCAIARMTQELYGLPDEEIQTLLSEASNLSQRVRVNIVPMRSRGEA